MWLTTSHRGYTAKPLPPITSAVSHTPQAEIFQMIGKIKKIPLYLHSFFHLSFLFVVLVLWLWTLLLSQETRQVSFHSCVSCLLCLVSGLSEVVFLIAYPSDKASLQSLPWDCTPPSPVARYLFFLIAFIHPLTSPALSDAPFRVTRYAHGCFENAFVGASHLR